MLSGGWDGEGVEVVGEDSPGGPGLLAVVAFEAAAGLPVTAFEVTDAAFAADAVARKAPIGASGTGGLAAGDECSIAGGEVLGDRTGLEAAVDGDFAQSDREPVKLGAGLWEQADSFGDPICDGAGRIWSALGFSDI